VPASGERAAHCESGWRRRVQPCSAARKVTRGAAWGVLLPELFLVMNCLPHAAEGFPPCVNYVWARRNDNIVTYASDSTANFINVINFNARQRERDKILCVLDGWHRKSSLSDIRCVSFLYKTLSSVAFRPLVAPEQFWAKRSPVICIEDITTVHYYCYYYYYYYIVNYSISYLVIWMVRWISVMKTQLW